MDLRGIFDDTFSWPENDLQGALGADHNIFNCPSTKKQARPTTGSILNPNLYSYGLNADPIALKVGFNPAQSTSTELGVIRNPAATAMVMENSFPIGGNWYYFSQDGLIPHGGGSNVLFFDGHVEHLPYAQVPTSGSDPFWNGL